VHSILIDTEYMLFCGNDILSEIVMPVKNFGIILIVTTVCYHKLEKTFNSMALIMAALCNRGAIIFLACDFYLSIFLSFFLFFSSPNLSGRRSDVCHTSTHGVALVRI